MFCINIDVKALILTPGQQINSWCFISGTGHGFWRCLECDGEFQVANSSIVSGKSKRCVACGHRFRRKMPTELSLDRKRKLKLLTDVDKVHYAQERQRYKAKSRLSLKGRAGDLYRSAVRHAKLRSVACTLDRQWIYQRLYEGLCQATGRKFDFGPPLPGEKYNWSAPSLDRIDPTGPYSQENVRVVVWRFNHCKSNLTDEDFVQFCRDVCEHL